MTFSKKTIFSVIGGIIVLGLIVFFVFFWKATISISVEPNTAQITIDEFAAQGNLTAKLNPGEYPLNVQLTNFIPLNETVLLGINEKKNLTINLKPLPQPTKLSDHNAQFMVLDHERQSLLFIDPTKKTAYRLQISDFKNLKIDNITPTRIEAVKNFNWSPSRLLAFWEQKDRVMIYDFKRYDLVTQTTLTLPKGIQSPDWRPDGQKIAYYFESSTGERTLIRANLDNSNPERIFNFTNTEIRNPLISWSPDGQKILVLTKKIHVLDVFSKQLTELKTKNAVAEAMWLPNSTQLIFRDTAGKLSLINLEGEITELTISTPLNRIVLLQDSSGMIFAQNQGNNLIIEKLDFVSGQRTPYFFDRSQNLFPINLILNKAENILFFTSQGKIYSLELVTDDYAL